MIAKCHYVCLLHRLARLARHLHFKTANREKICPQIYAHWPQNVAHHRLHSNRRGVVDLSRDTRCGRNRRAATSGHRSRRDAERLFSAAAPRYSMPSDSPTSFTPGGSSDCWSWSVSASSPLPSIVSPTRGAISRVLTNIRTKAFATPYVRRNRSPSPTKNRV